MWDSSTLEVPFYHFMIPEHPSLPTIPDINPVLKSTLDLALVEVKALNIFE